MPVRTKLRTEYAALTPSSRRVVDYILKNPACASHMSINEIAEASGVSAPTVTRLIRQLGYGGFMEFRVALASDARNEAIAKTRGRDSDILEEVFSTFTRAIEATLSSADIKSLSGLAAEIAAARHVLVYSTTGAHATSAAFSRMLTTDGVYAILAFDAEHANAAIGAMASGDIYIEIIHPRRKKEGGGGLVKAAKKRGVRTAVFAGQGVEADADYLFQTFSGGLKGEIEDVGELALFAALMRLIVEKR